MKRVFVLLLALAPGLARALPPTTREDGASVERPSLPHDLRADLSQDSERLLALLRGDRPTVTPADPDDLENKIREILMRHRTPGASVLMLEDGEVTWHRCFGFADLAKRTPVTKDTMFRAGSISKTLLAFAALRLVEQGKLSLDAKVKDLVPEVKFDNPWESSDPVTVAHLLEHTAGFDDWHFNEAAHDDPDPIPLEKALKLNKNSRRVRWRPGTRFSYSNVGPAVAARILEKISGKKYEDFLREELLQPLGMSTASFFRTPEVEERLTRGYKDDGVTEVPYWNILYRPSGALNVSPLELARLVQALLGRGTLGSKRLLTATSVKRMETPTTSLAGRVGMKLGYGLGNMASLGNGFLFHGHDGGMPGHLALFNYAPGKGCGFVIMLNAASPALGEIQQLVAAYLTRNNKRKDPERIQLPPETMREMAGTYRYGTPRHEISRVLMRWFSVEVVFSDGALFLDLPGLGQDIEMIPVSPNLFAVPKLSTPLFALVKDPDGGMYFQLAMMGFDRVPDFILKTERQIFSWISYAILSGLAAMLFWLPRLRIPLLSRGEGPIIPWPPMVPLLFFVAWMISLATLGENATRDLGHLTTRSFMIWILSWGFGLSSLWAIPATLRWTPSTGSPLSVLYALAISTACLVLALYLYYFGLIGIRTWAY